MGATEVEAGLVEVATTVVAEITTTVVVGMVEDRVGGERAVADTMGRGFHIKTHLSLGTEANRKETMEDRVGIVVETSIGGDQWYCVSS